jgi:hypothetical protein
VRGTDVNLAPRRLGRASCTRGLWHTNIVSSWRQVATGEFGTDCRKEPPGVAQPFLRAVLAGAI